MRSPRLFLQRRQVIVIMPVLLPVEGGGAYPEVPAGQPGVAMLGIMIHPPEPPGGCLGAGPLADQGPDVLGPRDQDPITLGCVWLHGAS
jgi:hypothetical protein